MSGDAVAAAVLWITERWRVFRNRRADRQRRRDELEAQEPIIGNPMARMQEAVNRRRR